MGLFAIVVVGCSGLFYVYFFMEYKPASEETGGKKKMLSGLEQV